MNTLTRVLLFTIFLLSAQNALACKCRILSVKEDYDNSDIVISGKVTGGRIITYRSDEDKRTLRRYTVRATKVYKGETKVRTFYIYTPTSSASCGSKLTVGRKYIVYANKDANAPVKQEKNAYWTNNCHRTKPFVQGEITELKALLP